MKGKKLKTIGCHLNFKFWVTPGGANRGRAWSYKNEKITKSQSTKFENLKKQNQLKEHHYKI